MPEYTQITSEMFDRDLKNLINTLVWKNRKVADTLDENTDAIIVDKYVSAAKKLLTKYTMSYVVEIPDMTNAELEATIKTATAEFRNCFRIIHDYQEFNDYYRMLSGLPNMNDSDYFYIQNEENIDPKKPIHELPIMDRYRLEGRGVIQKLIDSHPEKKYRYLNYLTRRNIKPFKARLANRFEIMYLGTSEIARLAEDFQETYEQCLFYMMHTFYSSFDRKNSDYYEEFVGMCILFMTIQQMHVRYLDADITRDFYDIDSLKVVYESYGVPFYPQIPVEYHMRIVKNINRLISYKGSHRVFYELSSLFDYRDMTIYQYFFVKEHRVDEEKNPIFVYNLDGSLNEDLTYEVKFAKCDIAKDPYLQIIDRNNHVDYDVITDEDQFWVDDHIVHDILYNNNYNFKESKYIGAQLMFSMTAFLFESCYFMKMLSDNKRTTKNLYVHHDYLGKKIPLFDLVVYVYAAICKKNGYAGNIPSQIEQVARVFGFNFKESLAIFREKIIENKYLDIEMLQLIRNMDINNLEDVHIVFSNIKKLHYYIEAKMIQCTDPHEYQAYSNLRRAMLTTELIPEIFQKRDGSIARTYMDLLEDTNYILYLRLNSGELKLTEEINHCLVILKRLSSELKYLEYIDGLDVDVIVEYLYRMMRFFKSAKAELVDFNVIYVLDSRLWNMIKYVDFIQWTTRDFKEPLETFEKLIDELSVGASYREFKERNGQSIDLIDYIADCLRTYYVKENIRLKTNIGRSLRRVLSAKEELRMVDDPSIYSHTTDKSLSTGVGLKDQLLVDEWKHYDVDEH